MNPTEYWLKPEWPAPANVRAATTLRTGGHSQHSFASLNLAQHVGDDPRRVAENRQMIKSWLNLPNDPFWLNQIHSSRVVQATVDNLMSSADASFTSEAGIVCAVMTADCLPLLLCSKNGTQVAAIHAGWKGLAAGIISNTLNAMQTERKSLQTAYPDFLAWMGPAIGPCCFQVGDDLRLTFLRKSSEYACAFRQQDAQHWLADIYQLAKIELATLGIDRIYGGDFCTMTDGQRFYSYRRDGQTGRMATLIWRSE